MSFTYKIKADSLFRKISHKVGYGTFCFPDPEGQITVSKERLTFSLPPVTRGFVLQEERRGTRITVLLNGEPVFLAEKWEGDLLPDVFIFKKGEWMKHDY